MSTPVHQLPTNKPPSMPVPDDPEVLNVLQEMEQEVKTATASRAPPGPVMPQPPPYMMQPPVAQYQIKKVQSAKWVNYDIMKRAAIIAAIAFVAFYPKTLESLYTSFPKLAFLEKFDGVVRAVILALIVYAVTIQFNI